MEHFKILMYYSNLGYDVMLTTIAGKDGIRMVKRYSHIAERHLICEQIYEHDRLMDVDTFRQVATFLYNDIQEQDIKKEFRTSYQEYLKE